MPPTRSTPRSRPSGIAHLADRNRPALRESLIEQGLESIAQRRRCLLLALAGGPRVAIARSAVQIRCAMVSQKHRVPPRLAGSDRDQGTRAAEEVEHGVQAAGGGLTAREKR